MRRRTLTNTAKNKIVEKKDAIAGVVCMYDSQKDELCFVDGDCLVYEEHLTPIGIVVIPTSHNVYGNGKCGVVSLKYMSRKAPNTGGVDDSNDTNINFTWHDKYGDDSIDTSLQNFNEVPEINSYNDETPTIKQAVYPIRDSGDYALATQGFTDLYINKSDPVTGYKYRNSLNDRNVFGPSPYLQGGGRNPIYYQNTSPMKANILSDFKGKNNTSVLCQIHEQKNTSWKTDSIISDKGCAPAACCWRYSTPGTKQGDWYLPAAGELCYMPSRRGDIISALYKIQKEYPKEKTVSRYYGFYLTSTEVDKDSVVSLTSILNTVRVWVEDKKGLMDLSNDNVLAFLQV